MLCYGLPHVWCVSDAVRHGLVSRVVPADNLQEEVRSLVTRQPFIHSTIHSAIHSFIHSFTHPFLTILFHSFVLPFSLFVIHSNILLYLFALFLNHSFLHCPGLSFSHYARYNIVSGTIANIPCIRNGSYEPKKEN